MISSLEKSQMIQYRRDGCGGIVCGDRDCTKCKVIDIAKYFGIHHSTVVYHLKPPKTKSKPTKPVKRNKPIKKKDGKTYAQLLAESRDRILIRDERGAAIKVTYRNKFKLNSRRSYLQSL